MASRYKGYTGKILEVDLTSGDMSEYELGDRDRELYLGGRFISTKILYDRLKAGIDPLSVENLLIVMTSPLTGTNTPSSSRYDISAKSPLTGLIGHSNSGGNFGVYLKRSGWDGVVVRGKAKKPVYLVFTGDEVRIESAEKLWGKNTEETQHLMIEKHGRGGTMAIGPAGENLVKFASVVSQERSHGRTGMGAVMGSKNLKGMIAVGDKKIELHEQGKFREHIKKWGKTLQQHPATGDLSPKYGTAQFLMGLSMNKALPTKNFSRGSYEDAYSISGERLAEEFLTTNYGCLSCPIRCGRRVKIDGKEVKGPEYETLCLFGSNILVNDMEAILDWNYRMDLLGMDSISTGTSIGFAMELNEKGMWKNGLEFGKKDNISKTLDDIAHKRGIGKDLSEGVRFLSKKYGGADFAPQVKGLELPGYEPRASVGHGLGYAVASRGACHLDGGYMIYFEVSGPVTLDPFHVRSKPGWVVLDQDLLSAISAGGNCLFTAWTFVPGIAYAVPGRKWLADLMTKILTYSWPLIDMTLRLPKGLFAFHLPLLPHTKALSLATGMKMSFGKFLQVGSRGYTLERLFNIREGASKKDDCLPKRFTEEQLIPGNKRSVVRIDKMLPVYYSLRGWDKNGVPRAGTLKKLGIAR